jgi:hypothetical protein
VPAETPNPLDVPVLTEPPKWYGDRPYGLAVGFAANCSYEAWPNDVSSVASVFDSASSLAGCWFVFADLELNSFDLQPADATTQSATIAADFKR